jgi:hypothetical protein
LRVPPQDPGSDQALCSIEELFVCRQLSGMLALEQNGREVALQSGDVTALDPQMPYLAKFPSGSIL